MISQLAIHLQLQEMNSLQIFEIDGLSSPQSKDGTAKELQSGEDGKRLSTNEVKPSMRVSGWEHIPW